MEVSHVLAGAPINLGDVVAATENPGRISLDLLDGFCLRMDAGAVEVSDMGQRLVAFVALGGRPLCRSLVAGTLWPEKTEARAAANLRTTLWRLNALEPSPTITCTGSSLALASGVRLDVAVVEEQGWALVEGRADKPLEVPYDWFAHELLPGWYEDWVIVARERLGQLQIRFLEALVNWVRERGDFARAIDLAMRLVAIDPLRERSQLTLIRALLEEGSWGRAQWQAEQYCHVLDGTFGPGASEMFMSAYRQLLPFGTVTLPRPGATSPCRPAAPTRHTSGTTPQPAG
jgi:DNA-binding SARP family transcriptional activator